jgi:hypothetical protein
MFGVDTRGKGKKGEKDTGRAEIRVALSPKERDNPRKSASLQMMNGYDTMRKSFHLPRPSA